MNRILYVARKAKGLTEQKMATFLEVDETPSSSARMSGKGLRGCFSCSGQIARRAALTGICNKFIPTRYEKSTINPLKLEHV